MAYWAPNSMWVQFPNQSNQTELNPSNCVWLGLAAELSQTQSQWWIVPHCLINKFSGTNIMLICDLKHKKYDLYWTNLTLKKHVVDFQHQFYKKSRVQKSKCLNVWFSSIVPLFLCEFDLVRLLNSIELNLGIEFNLLRLSLIEL